MPSDGRYMYPHPQANMSYEYGAYPPNTYDNSQYPPNHPGAPQRPPHPPTYPPHYGPPPHYVMPQQQWETPWPPYSAIHYPLAPGQPPPESVVPRQEPPPIETPRQQQHHQPAVQPPKPPDADLQPPPNQMQVNGNLNGPASQGKQRLYTNGNTHGIQLSEEFNFLKVSYRSVMESMNILNGEQIPNSVQRSPLEVLDKAINTADTSCVLIGTLKKLDQIQDVPVPSSAEMPIPEPQGSSTDKPRPSSSTDDSSQAPDSQTCLGCRATSTPEWRRGPMGPRTLCNACGLVYAKLIKRRGREARSARDGPSSGAGADTGDDVLSGDDGVGEDDDDDDDEEDSGEESHGA